MFLRVVLLILLILSLSSGYNVPGSSTRNSRLSPRCGAFKSRTLFANGVADHEAVLTNLKTEESKLMSLLTDVRSKKLAALRSKPLRIAVVGFGRFGQFIAKSFSKTSTVIAVSRSDYSSVAKDMGVDYYSLKDFDKVIEKGVDVVVLSTSILSFSSLLSSLLPPLRTIGGSQPSTNYPLIVDVLSVKSHPRRVMLESLPPHCDVLCTHPMFGPESGKNSWSNLNFVFEKTRLAGKTYPDPQSTLNDPSSSMDAAFSIDRVERFLSLFEEEGCNMVELSCEEHDRAAANSQFITHLVGRILGRQGLKPTPIDTKGFESVLQLIGSTNSDSFDLFYGLYKYNGNSMDTILKMKQAMEEVEAGLKLMEREDVNAPGFGGDAGLLGFQRKNQLDDSPL
ncbi:hypothetical protein TrLO_g12153 [Triparma laevis f. longispina]|uniref:Prephenate/arogenate dehydrogenase domain-containing protein n=1 Tax=Triparma laevis f. longispina TaxID=1714387 RepID=A0A9W7C805_9STRA|nr:hypothetical protein TrLO_g12153 [Triparma laevis f. longispina]